MGSYAHLAGVDEDRVVGAVAHEVGVADMMLDEAAAKDEHPAALGLERDVVELADVLRDVDHQPRALE